MSDYIVINKDLRTLTIPEEFSVLGVESDDDVNHVRFKMPRYYGKYDLSQFQVYINYLNANDEGDRYVVDDVAASANTLTFTWKVGRHACKYKGDVRFIVCMKKFNDKKECVQEFNTTVYSLPVLEGLETTEAVIQQNPDIIDYILQHIDGGGGGTSDISITYDSTKEEMIITKIEV
jgi:hypothetical protein